MRVVGKVGLILPGGGARAAYQVGVLKAIADLIDTDQLPFRTIAGISAGSINAAGLAQHSPDFDAGVNHLENIWSNLSTDDVFLMDYARLQGFLAKSEKPLSLLDNAPMRALLERELDPVALNTAVSSGALGGLAITASNYTTAEATTFIQTSGNVPGWHRHRHDAVRTEIGVDHLMASAALPVLFPPQKVGDEYYVDGSLRMTAPLNPAINLGVDRILVIGVRHEATMNRGLQTHEPGIAEIAGYTLDSLFSENLNADIERVRQINDLLEDLPFWKRRTSGRRRIGVMVIRPSEDLRGVAAHFSVSLPRGIRLFLRTVGGWGHEWRLPSYLLFQSGFARALIDLGYRDGLKIRPTLEAFLGRG